MRLVQFQSGDGTRRVGIVEAGSELRLVRATDSIYGLAHRAAAEQGSIAELASEFAADETEDYSAALAEGRVLVPLDHPVDEARCLVTGTGITHLPADPQALLARRIDPAVEPAAALLQSGLRGGRPAAGETGSQPEWFYKGDGRALVATGQPIVSPAFASGGGDEMEIAALFVVDGAGNPCRVGYALANEFTDHACEAANVLYMGHAKLRPCALGPELLLGPLPASVEGEARVLRGGQVIWQRPFASGEAHMAHSLTNLEHHLFRYAAFRRAGDAHVHLLGAAARSGADGVELAAGDVMELEAPLFGRALRNPLQVEPAGAVRIKQL